ncbi:hypothetical protein GGI42DRAFT_46896 [Trichoderma sp. SZMC 28013]
MLRKRQNNRYAASHIQVKPLPWTKKAERRMTARTDHQYRTTVRQFGTVPALAALAQSGIMVATAADLSAWRTTAAPQLLPLFILPFWHLEKGPWNGGEASGCGCVIASSREVRGHNRYYLPVILETATSFSRLAFAVVFERLWSSCCFIVDVYIAITVQEVMAKTATRQKSTKGASTKIPLMNFISHELGLDPAKSRPTVALYSHLLPYD